VDLQALGALAVDRLEECHELAVGVAWEALADHRPGEICEQFVAEMGFAGEQAARQCRWVAIQHGRVTGPGGCRAANEPLASS
jgi:hypothetical protein